MYRLIHIKQNTLYRLQITRKAIFKDKNTILKKDVTVKTNENNKSLSTVNIKQHEVKKLPLQDNVVRSDNKCKTNNISKRSNSSIGDESQKFEEIISSPVRIESLLQKYYNVDNISKKKINLQKKRGKHRDT